VHRRRQSKDAEKNNEIKSSSKNGKFNIEPDFLANAQINFQSEKMLYLCSRINNKKYCNYGIK